MGNHGSGGYMYGHTHVVGIHVWTHMVLGVHVWTHTCSGGTCMGTH